jgi:hypothetical protein
MTTDERIANGECVSPRGTDHCPHCIDVCEASHWSMQVHQAVKLTLLPNIEETLYAWLGSQGFDLKTFYTENDKKSDTPLLYFAKGEFHPCLFDKETDGKRLEDLYLTELAHVDERFSGTNLIFISDITFKIL